MLQRRLRPSVWACTYKPSWVATPASKVRSGCLRNTTGSTPLSAPTAAASAAERTHSMQVVSPLALRLADSRNNWSPTSTWSLSWYASVVNARQAIGGRSGSSRVGGHARVGDAPVVQPSQAKLAPHRLDGRTDRLPGVGAQDDDPPHLTAAEGGVLGHQGSAGRPAEVVGCQHRSAAGSVGIDLAKSGRCPSDGSDRAGVVALTTMAVAKGRMKLTVSPTLIVKLCQGNFGQADELWGANASSDGGCDKTCQLVAPAPPTAYRDRLDIQQSKAIRGPLGPEAIFGFEAALPLKIAVIWLFGTSAAGR